MNILQFESLNLEFICKIILFKQRKLPREGVSGESNHPI
jgi:hypothetical protein